jgi:polysaccharide biosynthesis transport protein
MALNDIWDILWKRRRLLFVTLVVLIAIVVAVTEVLPKTYRATATLFVGPTKAVSQATALDSSIGTSLTHTYSSLLADPAVADEVRAQLPVALTRTQLLDKMSFAPVELTQLVQVSAEDRSAALAATIANEYARVFVAHVATEYAAGSVPTTIAPTVAATTPTQPVRPNPPLYIGLGAVLALFLAVGVVLAVERLRDRIVPDEESMTVLGHPVLAHIPVYRRPNDMTARESDDAFRMMRVNLDLPTMIQRPRVLGVTSSVHKEGKTMVASHLAVTAAADGERVALLDADLRRAGLSELVSKKDDEDKPGLMDYLLGDIEFYELIQHDERLPGIDLILAGTVTTSPAALLRSRRLATLLDVLRDEYERVVIDTPPVLVAPDATLVLAHSDAAVYVVDVRRTRRRQAVAGLNQITHTSSPLAGLVLNRTDSSYAYGSYGRRAGRRPASTPPAKDLAH